MADAGGIQAFDPGAALGRLTALARAQLPPEQGSPALAAEAAYRRFREAHGAKRQRVRPMVLAPSFAVLAVALAAAWYVRQPPALTFAVAGGTVADGGYVHPAGKGETELRFSDGTEVRLNETSRTRVASTSRDGARVLLDHGRARVKVVPRKRSRWVFDAGPCRVHVTGTAFDMKWSAPDQTLEVRLYSGSVVVAGPPAPEGLQVRKGQRLVMDVRRGSARLEELPVVETIAAPAPAEPEAAPAEEPKVERAAPKPRRPETWSDRVLSGDFGGVLAEARRRGLKTVLRRGPATDVVAVADAARYAGDLRLARRALLTVRSRFEDSADAHKAAFLLGRMAEDGEGDLARALEWYGRYLDDAPGGAYQSEALGRKMTATLKLRGHGPARPLAQDYLRRYPRGSYAEPARQILANP